METPTPADTPTLLPDIKPTACISSSSTSLSDLLALSGLPNKTTSAIYLVILALVSLAQVASWSTPTNITNSPNPDADACMSSNGEKIAFARNDGNDWDL